MNSNNSNILRTTKVLRVKVLKMMTRGKQNYIWFWRQVQPNDTIFTQKQMISERDQEWLKLRQYKKVFICTIPVILGSPMGDRFPWKSGSRWKLRDNNAKLSSWRFSAKVVTCLLSSSYREQLLREWKEKNMNGRLLNFYVNFFSLLLRRNAVSICKVTSSEQR